MLNLSHEEKDRLIAELSKGNLELLTTSAELRGWVKALAELVPPDALEEFGSRCQCARCSTVKREAPQVIKDLEDLLAEALNEEGNQP